MKILTSSRNGKDIPIPQPNSLNRAKDDGFKIFLDEELLSIDGVMDIYPEIMSTQKCHHFQVFTMSRGSYIPSLVQECYTSYKSLMQLGMKHVAIVKPINSVLVQGTVVQHDPDSINVILGRPKNMEEVWKHLSKAISLHNMKDWLAPLI